jgi:hypothetical protein
MSLPSPVLQLPTKEQVQAHLTALETQAEMYIRTLERKAMDEWNRAVPRIHPFFHAYEKYTYARAASALEEYRAKKQEQPMTDSMWTVSLTFHMVENRRQEIWKNFEVIKRKYDNILGEH